MKRNVNSIAGMMLALLTMLSMITPVSVYAEVRQCKNCHDWVDISNSGSQPWDFDLSTGFYCSREACQRARKKESKKNIQTFNTGLKTVASMRKEAKRRAELCKAKLSEFDSAMKNASQRKNSANVLIPLIKKYLAELEALKGDYTKNHSRDYAAVMESMSDIDIYPVFWNIVVLRSNMEVIRHFWPKAVNAKDYETYYKKCSGRYQVCPKRGIMPFALGRTNPSDREILFCNKQSDEILLALISAGDVQKLSYFIEQCSPNSDFIIMEILGKIQGKAAVSGASNNLEQLRLMRDHAENSIERRKYEAQIKQIEADMIPQFNIHPAAWQLIISRLSENAYTDIIVGCNPDDVYLAIGDRRHFPSQETGRWLMKKMLQTPSPQLDKYNAYQRFLQQVKEAEKNASFLAKNLSAPDYPVKVRVFKQGDRLSKEIIVIDKAQNPLRPGYVGKRAWKSGLIHRNLPYRSGKKEGQWEWVPGLTSSMNPGYLSGSQEFDWGWTPGLIHANDPSLISGKNVNSWYIIPGYDRKSGATPKWVAGTKHPKFKGVVSGKTPRSWVPAEGYQWKNPENDRDFSVISQTK